MKSSIEATYSSRPLLAPRLHCRSAVSASAGWNNLPRLAEHFNNVKSGLYQLEALKPDRPYADTMQLHANTLLYAQVIFTLVPHLPTHLSGLCVWNVHHALAAANAADENPFDLDRYRSLVSLGPISEELFAALYNAAVALMQVTVLLSNRLQDGAILKLCINVLNRANAWWTALGTLRSLSPKLTGKGNDQVAILASGTSNNTVDGSDAMLETIPVYQEDLLGVLAAWNRAQLAELWVTYYTPDEETKRAELAAFCMLCSNEYGRVYDGILSAFKGRIKVADTLEMLSCGTGVSTLGRLQRTASVKRFYYLSLAAIHRAVIEPRFTAYLSKMATDAYDEALKSLKKYPQVWESERYCAFEADLEELASMCSELDLAPEKFLYTHNDDPETLEEALGDEAQLPSTGTRANASTIHAIASDVLADIKAIVGKLGSTLPPPLSTPWISTSKSGETLLQTLLPKAPPGQQQQQQSPVPDIVGKLFENKAQSYRVITRVGLVAKKLVEVTRPIDGLKNTKLVELLQQQFADIIHLILEVFFPRERQDINALMGLGRTIIDRNWELLASDYARVVNDIQTDEVVAPHIDTLHQSLELVRQELMSAAEMLN